MIYGVTAIGSKSDINSVQEIACRKFGSPVTIEYSYSLQEENGTLQRSLLLKDIIAPVKVFPTRALVIDGEWKEPFDLPMDGSPLEGLKRDVAWDHYFCTILKSLPGNTRISTYVVCRLITLLDDTEQR